MMKYVFNLYFCYKEIGTTLEYTILVNCPNEKVYEKEKEGYKVVCCECEKEYPINVVEDEVGKC